MKIADDIMHLIENTPREPAAVDLRRRSKSRGQARILQPSSQGEGLHRYRNDQRGRQGQLHHLRARER